MRSGMRGPGEAVPGWTEDAVPELGVPAPRAYVICATPRSGTTLLCNMLAESGAGRPASYFRRQSIPNWARRLGVPEPDGGGARGATGLANDFATYLDAIRRAGSAGTGHFGLRLMAETLGELLAALAPLYPDARSEAARMEAAFGPVAWIHVARADTVAQAVSLVRAQQSGLWHRNADGTPMEQNAPAGETAYDPARIAAQVALLEAQDAAWTRWFADQSIDPARIAYEDLAADPGRVLRSVLVAIGADPDLAERAAPSTARLADATSAAWIARYRSEQCV